MGTYKIGGAPPHNTLGFLCWGRSLKIHRNKIIVYEMWKVSYRLYWTFHILEGIVFKLIPFSFTYVFSVKKKYLLKEEERKLSLVFT
jgi:hypothetical protein